jgi:CRISPR-associated protein Csm2
MTWNEFVPASEITDKVTAKTVEFAKEFGSYLGRTDMERTADGRTKKVTKLTTNQLRKFFGEVKRQQLQGYDESSFVMLKPKLAYAVGRADKNNKIGDFYKVIATAMNQVHNEHQFKNFVQIFEAIVAYHKAAEEGNSL